MTCLSMRERMWSRCPTLFTAYMCHFGSDSRFYVIKNLESRGMGESVSSNLKTCLRPQLSIIIQ